MRLATVFEFQNKYCRKRGPHSPDAIRAAVVAETPCWMEYRPTIVQPWTLFKLLIGSELNSTSIPAAAAAFATRRE